MASEPPSERYAVRFQESAAEAVRKLPKKDRRPVIRKAEALAENPRPPQAKKLRGSADLYRVRAGNYRLFYRVEEEERIVRVTRVAKRADVYRGL